MLVKDGIVRAGGITFSLPELKDQVLSLASQPTFIIGFPLYGVAMALWVRVLSTEDLSTGYPLVMGLSFAMVILGAVVFLDEQVSWQKALGLGAIVVGVVLLSRA